MFRRERVIIFDAPGTICIDECTSDIKVVANEAQRRILNGLIKISPLLELPIH